VTLSLIGRPSVSSLSSFVRHFRFPRWRDLPSVLRVLHSTGKRVGFHAFRRYRAAVLRKGQVPEGLITLWLGHARTLTDRYATQLREDAQYRSEWCERAGLGFSVVTLLHANVVSIESATAA
jgi:integrase